MTLMKSWVASANSAETPFPLNNLPYGVFSVGDDSHCGVAIGDMILDVTAAEKAGLITLGDVTVFDVPYWNDVMDLGRDAWADSRAQLTALLAEGGKTEARKGENRVKTCPYRSPELKKCSRQDR